MGDQVVVVLCRHDSESVSTVRDVPHIGCSLLVTNSNHQQQQLQFPSRLASNVPCTAVSAFGSQSLLSPHTSHYTSPSASCQPHSLAAASLFSPSTLTASRFRCCRCCTTHHAFVWSCTSLPVAVSLSLSHSPHPLMTSRKRSRADSDDEKQEGGKGKASGDTITTFIRNTFNVRHTDQPQHICYPLLCYH